MERVTGIEPASSAWKAATLAIVLHPHGGTGRFRDSALPVFSRALCHLSYGTMVGVQGLGPCLPRPERGALTLTRYPGGGGDEIRTRDLPVAGRVLCQLSYTPIVEPAGFGPAACCLPDSCSTWLS